MKKLLATLSVIAICTIALQSHATDQNHTGAVLWTPNMFFGIHPKYIPTLVPHKILPGTLPCDPIADALEESCIEMEQLASMNCDTQAGENNTICQQMAVDCLSQATSECNLTYQSCIETAQVDCAISDTCYGFDSEACSLQQQECVTSNNSCRAWLTACSTNIQSELGACKQNVSVEYSQCVSSLGFCI
jgi:hypothetical protein